MNTYKYTILFFIIALKRYKRNSVIQKKPKYILCKHFNLSVNTFSKYLKTSIELGLIEEYDNHYKIIKFKSVLKKLFSNSGIYFCQHNILNSDSSTDFKKIKNQVEQLFVVDNIIKRQLKRINQKKKFSKSNTNSFRLYKNHRTGETTKEQLSRTYRDRVPLKRVKRLKCMESDYLFNDKVITSARNVANKAGYSISKANKILNKNDLFYRKNIVFWINGCNLSNYEMSLNLFSNAVVIPCTKLNKIKVCFGCEVNLVD